MLNIYSLVALKKRNSKASADSIDDFDSREIAGKCFLCFYTKVNYFGLEIAWKFVIQTYSDFNWIILIKKTYTVTAINYRAYFSQV